MSSRSVSSALGGKLGVLLLLLVTVASRAEDNLGEKISSEVRRLFDERRASTVRVEAYDRHGKLSGTGFFADPAGTIYTLSCRCECRRDSRHPRRSTHSCEASAGRRSQWYRLGQGRLQFPFIPVGNSKGLSLATPVLAIGFPVNLAATPSFGIVAGLTAVSRQIFHDHAHPGDCFG